MSLEKLIIPPNYRSKLTVRDTEKAIKKIKDRFEIELSKELNLERISAPLFLRPESGLNDNLNGVERPVSFDIKEINANVEIVQSLAKWKRFALKYYNFQKGSGLYTDMNAIRRDEDLDNTHSVYVDQWDWERVIDKSERNTDTLIDTVKKIYKAIKNTQNYICNEYPVLKKFLPDEIEFISSQELLDKYPDKTPKERENLICKEYGAVFIMKIGDKLSDGSVHDGRAPDYDDWQLNGDILIWNDILGCAFEVSSMGIRVDEKSLKEQLKKANAEERLNLTFHKMLLNGELPYTIGGGIGQSRLCMLYLEKAHIGEVQASVWSEEMIKKCYENNINLL